MTQAKANNISLEYESHGPEEAEPILMFMALGAQLTHWPKPMIDEMVAAGYRVITFDSRDIGLSEKMASAGVPERSAVWQKIHAGEDPGLPYRITDIAADAVGLMDALKIDSAHLVGLSFGSWVAQLVAADYPERARSLTLIATNSGNPEVPPPAPECIAILTTRPPDPNVDFEAFVNHWMNGSRTMGSKTFPRTPEQVRAQAEWDFGRCYYQDGADRQVLASMAAGDRREKLRTITVPTVVIHGAQDRLVPLAAGEDVAANIEGAELLVLEHMGHDMPVPLYGEIVGGILRAAGRAAEGSNPKN